MDKRVVKKEIRFNPSMGIDKRDENSAYFRNGIANTGTKGMYPAKDFERKQFAYSENYLYGIYGYEESTGSRYRYAPLVLTSQSSNFNVYDYRGTSTNWSDARYFDAFCEGPDGVYMTSNTKVYRINNNNDNISSIADFPSFEGVEMGVYDGLHYWWIGSKIWRQLPGGFDDPELVMSNSGFSGDKDPLFVKAYKDFLVIVTTPKNQSGGPTQGDTIFFFDKKNSTFFAKRIEMKQKNVLGIGVLEGNLIITYSETIHGKEDDLRARIVVAYWTGETFKELNSVQAGRTTVQPGFADVPNTTCSDNGEYMIFSVDENDRNKEKTRNAVYKVDKVGNIEVLFEPEEGRAIGPVYVSKTREVLASFGNTNEYMNVYYRAIDSNVYDHAFVTNYKKRKEYITNFYCNPYNQHTLIGLNISFEKMFGNANDGPPTPSGSLTVLSKHGTGAFMGWNAANDNATPRDELEYRIYVSDTNNIGSLAEIELNGTLVKDWFTYNPSDYPNVIYADFDGLEPNTTYWVNVMVRDNSDKRAVYTQITFTTNNSIITDWFSPTGYTNVVTSGAAQGVYTNPTRAYEEDGLFATANTNPGYITLNKFNLNIPTGATIKGMEIRTKGMLNSPGSSSSSISWMINPTKSAGLASGGTTEFNNNLAGQTTLQMTLAPHNSWRYIGDENYLGGVAWTPTEINDDTFGVMVRGSTSASPAAPQYALDVVQVRVYYEE